MLVKNLIRINFQDITALIFFSCSILFQVYFISLLIPSYAASLSIIIVIDGHLYFTISMGPTHPSVIR